MRANESLGNYDRKVVQIQKGMKIQPKDFQISKCENSDPDYFSEAHTGPGLFIDGSSQDNFLQWINRGEKETNTVAFRYREGPQRTIVSAYLTRDIGEGVELLASYG